MIFNMQIKLTLQFAFGTFCLLCHAKTNLVLAVTCQYPCSTLMLLPL